MEALAQTLSERVLIARKRLGLTQKEFAEKLQRDGLNARKWSAADISEIETGKMDPRLSEMLDITHALGHPVSWLLRPMDEAKPLYPNNIDPSWHERDNYISLPNESFWTEGHRAQPQTERLPFAASL